MTRIEVSNGASVSRIWGDGHTEFLACFQYDCDARDFAERKLAEDAARDWLGSSYAVSNHYDGKLSIFAHKPEKVSA